VVDPPSFAGSFCRPLAVPGQCPARAQPGKNVSDCLRVWPAGANLGLARRLGYAVEALSDLRLCRMPRDAGAVAQIAGRFACDPQALAELAGVGRRATP
jgi:hypothetical protein